MNRCLPLIALCTAVFSLACATSPAVPEDRPVKEGGALEDNASLKLLSAYELGAEPLAVVFEDNAPYNHQGFVHLPGLTVPYAARVSIVLEGTSDRDIAALKCFLVENKRGWKVLTPYTTIPSASLTAGESFSLSFELETTAASAGDKGNELVLYTDLAAVDAPPVITIRRLDIKIAK